LGKVVYRGCRNTQKFVDYTLLGRPFPTLTGLVVVTVGTVTITGLLVTTRAAYEFWLKRQEQAAKKSPEYH